MAKNSSGLSDKHISKIKRTATFKKKRRLRVFLRALLRSFWAARWHPAMEHSLLLHFLSPRYISKLDFYLFKILKFMKHVGYRTWRASILSVKRYLYLSLFFIWHGAFVQKEKRVLYDTERTKCFLCVMHTAEFVFRRWTKEFLM